VTCLNVFDKKVQQFVGFVFCDFNRISTIRGGKQGSWENTRGKKIEIKPQNEGAEKVPCLHGDGGELGKIMIVAGGLIPPRVFGTGPSMGSMCIPMPASRTM